VESVFYVDAARVAGRVKRGLGRSEILAASSPLEFHAPKESTASSFLSDRLASTWPEALPHSEGLIGFCFNRRNRSFKFPI
jgi:hypothetical protein